MAAPSLTRLRRFVAFAVAALLALWLSLLIAGYAGGDWTGRSYEPAPARVAAIVTLVEATPPERRPALLAALRTPIFRLRLLAPDAPAPPPVPLRADERLMRRYAAALAGHRFTVGRMAAPAEADDPVHFVWQRRRLVVLQIGLASGGRLLIAATSPTIVTGLGIPVGVGAGAIGTLIALIAVWRLWRETAPLSQLARATERIDLSGTPVPLPATRGQSHEIRALALAISRLQERLSAVLQGRMALLGGISHDLRTFTARLRLRVEAIPDPDQRGRAVADIEDMMRLLDDALLAARGSAGAGGVTEELVDLAALLVEEVESLAAQGLPVTLAAGAPASGLFLLAEPLALRRIVQNLAGNAVRYGGAARIALLATPDRLQLSVADDGPGIPPEVRVALQEPFARGESSRNRATGGAGLGLAVARSLVEAIGGELSLDPARNGGATVAVFLPRFTEI